MDEGDCHSLYLNVRNLKILCVSSKYPDLLIDLQLWKASTVMLFIRNMLVLFEK